jgi:hypothetical protein
MPWFLVDDGLAFHPKIIAAGNAATGLWARAGSWSAQHLTEGSVSADIARTLGSRAEAVRLVDAGLWVPDGTGYLFHDWDQIQPTKETVLADREAAKLRQRRAREKARAARLALNGDGDHD